MKISVQQYAQSLYELLKDQTESKVKELLTRFVILLDRKRDLSLAPQIENAFTDIWNKNNGEVVAQLTSARELEKESRETVINYIKEKSGAEIVVLEEKLDKKILGGFILKYNNRIIDGSLRNSLAELKTKLEA